MMLWAVLCWEMKLMESCWGWRSIGLWHIIYLLYIWRTTPWDLLLCSWLANRHQPIPAQHDSNHRNKVKMSFYTFELRPPSSFCFFWAWVSRILPAITAPSLLVEAFLSAILSWSLSQNSAFNPLLVCTWRELGPSPSKNLTLQLCNSYFWGKKLILISILSRMCTGNSSWIAYAWSQIEVPEEEELPSKPPSRASSLEGFPGRPQEQPGL